VTWAASSSLSATRTATLSVDLETHDYSPGNAAGNVPGVYKFLITTVDSNDYVQSFPVSINIAVPSPKSAVTPLAVTGTAGLNYTNGGKLTYSKTVSSTAGATPSADVLSLVSDVGMDGNAEHKWTAVPVGTGLPAANFALVARTGSDKDKATLTINMAAGAPAVGLYPYLISALDAKNIVQTVFYTIEIVA
jgi:hypothetical protein